MTITAPKIEMPVKQARELYRKYKEHQHYSEPIDDEVRRTYQLIAQGRVVIRALEAIKLAGVDGAGLPKLAIMRATQRECCCTVDRAGGVEFRHDNGWRRSPHTVRLPSGSLPAPKERVSGRAMLPTIPIHLRPKRGLANYHVLWEAEWTRIPPVDPLLIRRIGKADLWLVVAAWDLTPVEQAALAGRMSA